MMSIFEVDKYFVKKNTSNEQNFMTRTYFWQFILSFKLKKIMSLVFEYCNRWRC